MRHNGVQPAISYLFVDVNSNDALKMGLEKIIIEKILSINESTLKLK